MKFDVAAKSSVGRIRRNNEDNLILDGEILPLEHKDSAVLYRYISSEGGKLVGVFDGMGGYSDGEKASYIAAMTAMLAMEHKSGSIPHEQFLHSLCMEMNDEVCKEADGSGMGTTCALLFLYSDRYTVCNIGDSPVFLVRNGEMKQISVDHNQKATFERATGKPAPANQKFKLTQCIGIPKDEMIIEPHIASDVVQVGDFFLLCSDGVTDMVPFEEIEAVICEKKTSGAIINELILKAMDAGGRDNITAVCVAATGAESRVRNMDGFLKRFFG